MKNKKILFLLLAILMLGILSGCGNSSDEVYRIRFKDLVKLDDLQKYNNKTVEAVGYLSPIGAYDGSFTYLMNLPYQTCPYCDPSDVKITNTIAIFAKEGSKIEFTEAAVIVSGTLKLEEYTDSYGYSYNYRLVDVTVTQADSSIAGDKVVLYNEIADKEILDNLLNTLAMVEGNVFHDEYIEYYGPYDMEIVDTTRIIRAIDGLKHLNRSEFDILLETANILLEVTTETNKLIENEDYSKLIDYKEKINECYNNINAWMSEYEL